MWRSACSNNASTTSNRPAAIVRAWRRRYMRGRVAIWSLRDRPARNLPPSSGPTRSMRMRSSAPCTSSSDSEGDTFPAATSSRSAVRATTISAVSASVSKPGALQGVGMRDRRCQVVVRIAPVKVSGDAELRERLRGPTAEAAAPQRSLIRRALVGAVGLCHRRASPIDQASATSVPGTRRPMWGAAGSRCRLLEPGLGGAGGGLLAARP